MYASEDLLKEHYIELKDRPFHSSFVKYMNSGPVVVMVQEVLSVVKIDTGGNQPQRFEVGRNIIQGSDSKKTDHKEFNLWFKLKSL